MTAPAAVLRDAAGNRWVLDPATSTYTRADWPAAIGRRRSRVHIEVVYGPVTEEDT